MTSSILRIAPLGSPWKTIDPFLVCVHHVDRYPAGNADLGPKVEPGPGQDWRMYFGETVPGFPAHPHRGFETITIVRQGIVDHSDSLGASARFGAGDVQWLTAGRGIVHAEMFPLLEPDAPNPMALFQIWLNLPAKNKMVDPAFRMFWADDIPRHQMASADGHTEVVFIAGRLPGIDGDEPPAPPPGSYAADPKSDVAIWTIRMTPGARWRLPPAGSGTRRQLFFFEGSGLLIDGEQVQVGSSIEVDVATTTDLVNGAHDAEILMLQGRPLDEPVAQHGPFVMNSLEQIRDAYAAYRETRFGDWAWPTMGPNHGARGRFASR